MRPEPETPNSAVISRAELWLTIGDPFADADPEGVESGGDRPGPLGHLGVGQRAPRRRRLVRLVDDARPGRDTAARRGAGSR